MQSDIEKFELRAVGGLASTIGQLNKCVARMREAMELASKLTGDEQPPMPLVMEFDHLADQFVNQLKSVRLNIEDANETPKELTNVPENNPCQQSCSTTQAAEDRLNFIQYTQQRQAQYSDSGRS